jgi:hypothetical protein
MKKAIRSHFLGWALPTVSFAFSSTTAMNIGPKFSVMAVSLNHDG